MEALFRIVFTLILIWVVGGVVLEFLSGLWQVFVDFLQYALLGAAALLINLFVALDRYLAVWPLPHPAWSWALAAGVFGATLHLGCAGGRRLRSPWIPAVFTLAALTWLIAPSVPGVAGLFPPAFAPVTAKLRGPEHSEGGGARVKGQEKNPPGAGRGEGSGSGMRVKPPPAVAVPPESKVSGATPSMAIEITAPDVAENGAVVPVTVAVTRDKVKEISLYSGDLSRLALKAEISPQAAPYLATRVKLVKTGPVIVTVVAADGRRLRAEKMIKVTVGAGPEKDTATALDIKLRGQGDTIKMLLTAAMGPESYVSRLMVSSGKDWLARVEVTPWISTNPYFSFKSARDVNGQFAVQATLNNGKQLTKSVP